MTSPSALLCDIIEFPSVERWLSELARTDPVAFLRLIRPNGPRLRALWGAPAQRRPGPSGELIEAWIHKERGLVFWVFTSSHGTLIKVEVPTVLKKQEMLDDPRVSIGIISLVQGWLQVLDALANGTPPPQS